jgi:hypothetical protein
MFTSDGKFSEVLVLIISVIFVWFNIAENGQGLYVGGEITFRLPELLLSFILMLKLRFICRAGIEALISAHS